MREIKFRAWDSETKEMLLNVSVRNSNFIYAIQTSGNDSWDVKYIEVPEFKIMQYTGLKDKNDKEIYEDDIVKFGNNKIHENTHGKVEYSNKRAQFIYLFIDGIYKDKCTDMHDDWRTYEVIGNIHENPELLEVKDV